MPEPIYLYKLKEIMNPDPKKPRITVHEYVCIKGCGRDILQHHPESGWERNISIPNKPIVLYYPYHNPIAPEVFQRAIIKYQEFVVAAQAMAPLEEGEAHV